MPQIRAFIGSAGSGKTFALIEEVERTLAIKAMSNGQAILAITFMHGSRRRLATRLSGFARRGVPTQCDTIDSFCLRLVNRFRRYLGKLKPVTISPSLEGTDWEEGIRELKTTFTSVRNAAIELLQSATVRSTVAAAFPIIVVDEFQDCDGELLEIVRLLAMTCTIVVAADGFQFLSSQEECPARLWLDNNQADIVELSGNRRTNEDVLRETAAALREGRAASSCIEVHVVAPGLAAWHISSRLSWGKIPVGKSKALICPVRPESSSWFQAVLDSLSKELGKSSKVGPNPFKWEGAENEQLDEACELLVKIDDGKEQIGLLLLDGFVLSENYMLQSAARQARRLIGLRGDDGIAKDEFTAILQQTAHSASAFRRERQNARVAMTVHGAKNREFDFVFIAWPYEVAGDTLLARKLLYNAVTRAREGAVLFVQGDKKRVAKDGTLSLLECGIVDNKGFRAKRKGKAS